MNDKNKKPELLEEGFFSSLFQLHFLQQMFGGGVEGWDPDQEKFLAAQEQLPDLKTLMDKYDGDREKCAQDPKCRSQLGKIMNNMPDELKAATREAYQLDAAEQLGEAETSILSLIANIAQQRTLTLDVEPFKSMENENKEKFIAVYDKVAKPSMNMLVKTWANLLTVIEKNKKDLPPAVAKEIDLGSFQSEVQKAMGAYQHLEEMSTGTDPYSVGPIGGPRSSGQSAAQDTSFSAEILPTSYGSLEEAEEDSEGKNEDHSKALEKAFGGISKMMTDATTEIKTLAGYMTGTDESPFGLDQMASKDYAERLMGLINQIDDALFKRFPNMVARVTGLKAVKKDPAEVGPDFDPSKMDAHEKMKKAEELVMLLKKYKQEGNKESVMVALKSINLISEPLAKKVADKYGIKIDELNESRFYESFGDFS